MPYIPPPDEVDLRPWLTAKPEPTRHCPVPLIPPQVLATSRSLARHFNSVGRTPCIRPASSRLLQPRQAFVRARKILSRSAARKALVGQVRYLAREGTEPDGRPTRFFDRSSDDCDPDAFLARAQPEAGHYRIVAVPDDSHEVPDIRAFTRELATRIDQAVGVETDWLAAAHHDTGRPHVHLLLMDAASGGRRLGLSGSFLNHGIRTLATDVANQLMGPRVERASTRTIKADRFTPLDQVILDATDTGQVTPTDLPEGLRSDGLRRIVYLETQGLISASGPGRWQVPPDLRQRLRAVAQADARIIAATRAVARSDERVDINRLQSLEIAPGEDVSGAFIGVHRLGPYPAGAQVIVLDTTDGRLGHILMRDLNAVMGLDGIPHGAVINIRGGVREPRAVDLGIAETARATGGFWSEEEHRQSFPQARGRFLSFNSRRLAALSVEGACSSVTEGRYAIGPDFLTRALAADARQWGKAELHLRILDHRTLSDQTVAQGLTWLDSLLTRAPPPLTGSFGSKVEQAMEARERSLRTMEIGGGVPHRLAASDIAKLRLTEVETALGHLVKSGKELFYVGEGQHAAGVYVERVHITGAPLAVLEDKAAIHLISWRPGLEACRGRAVTATIENGLLNFRSARAASTGLSL